jgi:hypothetical protein
MKRVIQDHIKRPLADELLFGSLSEHGGEVTVDLNPEGKGLSLAVEVAEAQPEEAAEEDGQTAIRRRRHPQDAAWKGSSYFMR